MDPRHQPGSRRPRLPAAGDRLAAPARGLFRLLRLALPRLGGRVARRSGRPTCPGTTASTEFMLSSAWPLLLACAVQFFLSFAGLRSRIIENIIALQWVAMPLSLLLAGHARLFLVASLWYALLAAELAAVRGAVPDHGAAAAAAGRRAADGASASSARRSLAARVRACSGALTDADARYRSPNAWCRRSSIYVGVRLFLMFARALRETVADRNRLAEQMHRMSTEMEARVEQLDGAAGRGADGAPGRAVHPAGAAPHRLRPARRPGRQAAHDRSHQRQQPASRSSPAKRSTRCGFRCAAWPASRSASTRRWPTGGPR